ncbi:hypothetical protein [Spiroplasma endosymbiont of Lasioglossum malachurum]|uniref:hypothetical protein n=1 Tax=Spiroplasma endosymbiont of Lasioglossum malachurum TaxID=3066319 RepID=UPI0030D14323
MKFKQLLLLITTVTSLGMILSNNKIINSNQNTTFLNKNNVSKISFNKMTGTTGEINSLTFKGEQTYAVNSEGIVYKSDNGQSFEEINLLNYDYKIKSLITTPNGTIYVGTYNEKNNELKVYILKNDQLAEKYTLSSYQLLAMTFDKKNNIYIGTNQGVYTNSSPTTELEKIDGATGSITVLKTTKNGLIYAGNTEGMIFKSIGGNPFNLVEQLKDGGITSIAVDNKETIFVTNNSKKVYYKRVTIANFLPYKQILETINTTVITFGTGVLVGDKDGNIWKSYQEKNFTLFYENKFNSINELIYNSNNFTIYATTTDGIYKNK